ncbi:RNA 2',3'-cyclic phosphodiesterase [Micromonospora sp. ATCC 39149]|uniref:RNA 2',3'-cyclic phosphodiesterase n=1 Tax=Micromonospora carbonacea TaxID=47853 RepID=A0A7D6CGS1_9ACTN|nr:RNA 2',3'-cyclic phosphodiesterase [Micromonospora sp. ATCC 39149]QLK01161.1 RNA 2' [Micromonospora carbonacea]
MRLFVAVHPPPEAVADLSARVARLRVARAAAAGTDTRLTDPAQAHLTVAFLGTVDTGRLVKVESALGLAAETFRGGRSAQPVLRLGGGGSFGQGRSTVLWVDVRGEVEALRVLGRLVRSGLRRGRLPCDERPFTPHLTVARPGDRIDPADVAADREALHGYLGPPWPATELVLVRSRQGPRPAYDRVAAWPL